MVEDGSKFPEVDTFEFAYAGKNKCWTCNAAKAQNDEMLVKEHEYLIERAKEQQLLQDIPLEEIPIDDPDAGINIMMSVLGTKPGRRILGLGDGRLRDIGISSSNVHNLEKELEAERAARKVADAARVSMEQNMQNKLKVVEQQFNSTLQSRHHSMHQLCGKVPGSLYHHLYQGER
ncbi:Hypothetical predicted protein [Olea europaea subsp. europaea]|uniref:Uncharacterized protein n=1 Tax=Olea europaea subsp. europaea TaxID=158383 RepID=A0A8S0T553_OLEEU|nr:Hypothetical predicted protein [Olea europaea subsp. europaea]